MIEISVEALYTLIRAAGHVTQSVELGLTGNCNEVYARKCREALVEVKAEIVAADPPAAMDGMWCKLGL